MTTVDSRPNTPLLIGGGVLAASGVTVGAVGATYKARVGHNERKVETRTAELTQAQRSQKVLEEALAADRVHPPAGTSASDAKRWLTERYAAGDDVRAITRDASMHHMDIARMGQLTRSAPEAVDAAASMGEGRAAGVVRAGEWHAPVRFDDPLLPLEKTRQVTYTETKWEYHYGPNPRHGNKYEHHFGPHPVQKTRTEQYLDPFNRFRGAHDGVTAVLDGRGRELEQLRTLPELRVDHAAGATAEAQAALRSAENAVKFGKGGAKTMLGVGIGAAVIGAGAAGATLVSARD